MGASNLLLDTYINSLQDGVSPVSGVYAIIMNNADQGLLNNGSGSYAFSGFSMAYQQQFGIPLPQHMQRTRYYSQTLLASAITIPDTVVGFEYIVEFWEHSGSGDNYNRANDLLFAVSPLRWFMNQIVETQYQPSQQEWVSQVAISYDSSTSTIHFSAWLENQGQLVTNPASCTFTWYDRSDAVITSHTDPSPNAQGQFYWDVTPMDLAPDLTTFCVVAITDANGNVWTSAASPITWD